MIAYLNFCNHDRDQALRLIQWIGKLGGVKNHDLVLQSSQGIIREGLHAELFEEAKKHFKAVDHFTPFTEDERGWPHSPNHGWMQALQHVREKLQQPWFWMEPDCVPLKPTWLDEIEKEYVASKKPFMGAEVIEPAHRMSGIGVYPAMVVSYMRNRRLGDMHIRNEAFDSYFAPEIVPNAHFTKLIQQVHFVSRNPDVLPTFPDAESLKTLDPQAVIFHRCKDLSLIQQLMNDKAGVRGMNVLDIIPMELEHRLIGVESTAVNRSSREAELLAEIESLRAQLPIAESKVLPAATNKATIAKLSDYASRAAKANETKRKKKERSEKMKAAWARRKSKVTV